MAVYFVALFLFPDLSYAGVWGTLTVAVAQMGRRVAMLAGLRRRLGPDPLRELFKVVAGPLGQPRTAGVSYRGMRRVALVGCKSARVAESEENVDWLGRHKLAAGAVAAYPLLSVMALVETGTRTLLGAVLGPVRGERLQSRGASGCAAGAGRCRERDQLASRFRRSADGDPGSAVETPRVCSGSSAGVKAS